MDDVVDTGTASHIFAAAAGGPRGTGGLSEDNRASTANGIWLCAACGRLVDANAGNEYPVSLLRSWRDLHEYRTRVEQGGARRPAGWIQSMEIRRHFVLNPGVVQLARCNLLFGPNGSGKTQLLSLLRSLSQPLTLMDGYKKSICTINWFDPEPRSADVEVDGPRLRYRVDGREVPLPPRPYRVFEFSAQHRNYREAPTLRSLAASLDVDEWIARAVVDKLPIAFPEIFATASVAGGELEISYRSGSRAAGHVPPELLLHFYALVVLADLQAQSEPTLLVLDEPFVFLHPPAERQVLQLLSSSARTFQTFLSSHSLTAFEQRNHGWNATVLLPGPAGGFRISQLEEDIEAIGRHHE
ncbi:AAA family ATPase [Kitasatospora sp. NPDC056651]|uniref:AAA family ATPase n=1 Tax=Kitasatospora sp. NPDC056651 TaxID=3345892 RepID=UPI0036739AAB